MEKLSKQQQVIDFFHLKPPKIKPHEALIHIIIFLSISYAIIKLFVPGQILPMLSWLGILALSMIFYWKPIQYKQKRYNDRISPFMLNNYLLERCSKKILKRAIEYLQVDTENMKPEQFIVIPYPVFHRTKNIKDDFIQRLKSDKKCEQYNDDANYYNYSYWNIQVLILTERYISFYFCGYNLLTDEIMNERSNEYFYHEIATIKTEVNEVSFVSKWHENPITEAMITKIIHNSGDILNLITEIPALEQPPQTVIDIEKVEKTIRMLLRHAKIIDDVRKPVRIEFNTKPSNIEAPIEIEL